MPKHYDPNECYKLMENQKEEKKVKPKDVFEGYTPPNKQSKKKKCPKGHKVCKCHMNSKKKT